MTRGLIDATRIVQLRGWYWECARNGHRGTVTRSTWVRVDVARGARVCANCGLEWCGGRQHGRRPL